MHSVLEFLGVVVVIVLLAEPVLHILLAVLANWRRDAS